MKARLTQSLIDRIRKLEMAQGIRQHEPVAMLPRLMPVDEWSELASKMQYILKDNITKDIAPEYGDLPKLELVASL